MLSTKDAGFVYETVLGTPGMSHQVKIDFKTPRKNVLFICKLIELGLSLKDSNEGAGLLSVIDDQTMQAVKATLEDMLEKAGLQDTNERLMKLLSLQSK